MRMSTFVPPEPRFLLNIEFADGAEFKSVAVWSPDDVRALIERLKTALKDAEGGS